MEKRKLGKTGEMLSVVGFGGILVRDESAQNAARLVSRAVNERGVNYFDVAPSYGNAQQMLGPALEPYRKNVFLACKTEKRDAAGARQELEQSLRDLRTDHLDLYQLHAVKTVEEVEQILGPDGALETFLKAREEGKTRYLGFSAHSEEAAFALMKAFAFDTILVPVNYAAWLQEDFGPRAVSKAQELDMGILALKALAKRALASGEPRPWPKAWYYPVESAEEAALGMRFTLSQPVTAAVTPGHEHLFEWACDAADAFTPITEQEIAVLKQRALEILPVFPH